MGDDDLFQGDPVEPLDLRRSEPMFTKDHGIDVHLKRIVKKAEVQYTPEIEEILEKIEANNGQLAVTHTVSLSDVKKNIDKWKPSAMKEFNNLTEAKRAFTVRKRHTSSQRTAELCHVRGCTQSSQTRHLQDTGGKQGSLPVETMYQRTPRTLTCLLRA